MRYQRKVEVLIEASIPDDPKGWPVKLERKDYDAALQSALADAKERVVQACNRAYVRPDGVRWAISTEQ